VPENEYRGPAPKIAENIIPAYFLSRSPIDQLYAAIEKQRDQPLHDADGFDPFEDFLSDFPHYPDYNNKSWGFQENKETRKTRKNLMAAEILSKITLM
jgi:hypothetical protein